MTLRNRYFINRLLGVAVLFCCCSISAAGADQLLKGDAVAMKRLHQMLETLGGEEVWANAKSLYIMQRARTPSHGDGIVASYWRDLEAPGEWASMQYPDFEASYIWHEKGGWIGRKDHYRDFTEDEIGQRVYDWHRELYTLYHQLARGERALMLASLAPDGFRVYNEKHEKIADFRLSANGELYRWQQYGGKDVVAYVFGPNKSFGEIKFPDWGAAIDGRWSFYNIQVVPSVEPFSSHVSFKKPVTQWHGGAIHNECIPPGQ